MGLSWAGPHRNSHSTLEQLEQSYDMSFVSIGTVFKKKKREKKKRKKKRNLKILNTKLRI